MINYCRFFWFYLIVVSLSACDNSKHNDSKIYKWKDYSICSSKDFFIEDLSHGKSLNWEIETYDGDMIQFINNPNSEVLESFAQNYSEELYYLIKDDIVKKRTFQAYANLLSNSEAVESVLERFSIKMLNIDRNLFRLYIGSKSIDDDLVIIIFGNFDQLDEILERNKQVLQNIFIKKSNCSSNAEQAR